MAGEDPLLDPDYRYALNRFTGNGTTTTWNLTFAGGFIDRSHVKAYLVNEDGSLDELGFSWITDTTVSVTPAVAGGQEFVFYRDTPKSAPLVDFNGGSAFTERNLDTLSKQAVFIGAETIDRFAGVEERTTAATAAAAAATSTANAADDKADQAIEDAAGAIATANAATATADNVASQFDALATTVEELVGEDLSGIARLDTAQVFAARQEFSDGLAAVNVGSTAGLEILASGGYRIKAAGVWGAARSFHSWSLLEGVPTEFPPEYHTQDWATITGKPSTFTPSAHTHTYESITGKPSTFTPSAHTHAYTEVTADPAVTTAVARVNQLYIPGEIKQGLFAAVPTGWIVPDGTTIGNAASGAGRANADTVDLFAQLWALDATVAPLYTSAGVLSSRGASAAADYAANRRIVVPDLRGVFLRSLSLGSSIDAGRVLGSLQLGQNEGHTHTVGAGINDTPNSNIAAGSGAIVGYETTSSSGGDEARPINVAVRVIIKL
jgi:hypothetical protein